MLTNIQIDLWDLPLPINEPQAAVEEFKRCIKELGFKGALIMGHLKWLPRSRSIR